MTAKPVVKDDQILGYEVTPEGLRPMNAEQYRAFLQVGVDQLDRGEGIGEAEMNRFFDELIASLPPE